MGNGENPCITPYIQGHSRPWRTPLIPDNPCTKAALGQWKPAVLEILRKEVISWLFHGFRGLELSIVILGLFLQVLTGSCQTLKSFVQGPCGL